jgi:hypothetical protein
MLSYQFDSREQDAQFLAGRPVLCKMILTKNQSIEPQDQLVILLSTGTKYKGTIRNVNFIYIGGTKVGEAEILKG